MQSCFLWTIYSNIKSLIATFRIQFIQTNNVPSNRAKANVKSLTNTSTMYQQYHSYNRAVQLRQIWKSLLLKKQTKTSNISLGFVNVVRIKSTLEVFLQISNLLRFSVKTLRQNYPLCMVNWLLPKLFSFNAWNILFQANFLWYKFHFQICKIELKC